MNAPGRLSVANSSSTLSLARPGGFAFDFGFDFDFDLETAGAGGTGTGGAGTTRVRRVDRRSSAMWGDGFLGEYL